MFSLFCFTVYTKNNANKSKAYETPKIFWLQIQLKPVRIEFLMAFDCGKKIILQFNNLLREVQL